MSSQPTCDVRSSRTSSSPIRIVAGASRVWFVFVGDSGLEWHDLEGNRLDWIPGIAGAGLACATQ